MQIFYKNRNGMRLSLVNRSYYLILKSGINMVDIMDKNILDDISLRSIKPTVMFLNPYILSTKIAKDINDIYIGM